MDVTLVFDAPISDRDVNKITPWEFTFIVFAAAFTLDEYTVANEHGWISVLPAFMCRAFLTWLHTKVYVANARPFLSPHALSLTSMA